MNPSQSKFWVAVVGIAIALMAMGWYGTDMYEDLMSGQFMALHEHK